MAVRSRRRLRDPKPIEILALAYAAGVAGTLWDWRQHLLGPGTQQPHLLIYLAGLLLLGVLAFSGRMDYRSRSFTALYGLLVLVILISIGPYVLMEVSPRSTVMAGLMQSMTSNRAVLVYLPLVLLASWSAWRWLSQTAINWWRLAAALGIVVAAVATVWDVYWHQTRPVEMHASMASLPPHQAILAGFLIGLVGAAYGAIASINRHGSAGIDSAPHGSATSIQ